MTTLTIINDWHIGAIRTGGTTQATAYALQQQLLAWAEDILATIDGDLLVNGDLFDGPDIPRADMLAAYRLFASWLQRTGRKLYAANGNHDLDKNATRLSSFQFFVALLWEMYPGQVVHIAEGTYIKQHDTYVIPHVTNQDLFDLELAKVPTCTQLCVHANYNNGFAVESDHSLNMSEEQARAAPVDRVIFGHEHQAREELDGKVVIVGNQFPSSISDCLNNDTKRLLVTSSAYTSQVTWQAAGSFIELDWHTLASSANFAELVKEQFVRVAGTAAASEATKVATALSKFRAKSEALVITNAVKIAGTNDSAELPLSHEEITSFSVREALRPLLTEDENKKVDHLLGNNHAA